MKFEYDSWKNCANPMKRTQFFSGAHFATPFPSAHCNLAPVNWTYTFSAKEKDTETGLSYFGSRYYSSDLSIWLSVDQMSDKYPSLSPYVYCANNPIKLVDPDGRKLVFAKGTSKEFKKQFAAAIKKLAYSDDTRSAIPMIPVHLHGRVFIIVGKINTFFSNSRL